jgi:hypothetical protein
MPVVFKKTVGRAYELKFKAVTLIVQTGSASSSPSKQRWQHIPLAYCAAAIESIRKVSAPGETTAGHTTASKVGKHGKK